ncbi:MAG: hypothetical protein OHK0029_26640 [Armatimonadaceae bacterium]
MKTAIFRIVIYCWLWFFFGVGVYAILEHKSKGFNVWFPYVMAGLQFLALHALLMILFSRLVARRNSSSIGRVLNDLDINVTRLFVGKDAAENEQN